MVPIFSCYPSGTILLRTKAICSNCMRRLIEGFGGKRALGILGKIELCQKRESTKHGPLVHGPLSWTGSMDPLFLLPLLIRSKTK